MRPSDASGVRIHGKLISLLAFLVGLLVLIGAPVAPALTSCARPTQALNEGSMLGTSGPAAGEIFNGSDLDAWALNQSACLNRIQAVPAPGDAGSQRALGGPASIVGRSGQDALRFTTEDSDVSPLTPTDNPRAQIISPWLIKRNHSYWETFEVYLPRSFPATQPSSDWIGLQTPMYGRPFASSPPAGLSIATGHFRFALNNLGPHPWAIAWQAPEVRGRWERFTWHFLASTHGWIELYVNGREVTLKPGAHAWRRMPIAMIDGADDEGPWYTDLQLYYKHGAYPRLTVYYRGFRLGTSRRAVLGH